MLHPPSSPARQTAQNTPTASPSRTRAAMPSQETQQRPHRHSHHSHSQSQGYNQAGAQLRSSADDSRWLHQPVGPQAHPQHQLPTHRSAAASPSTLPPPSPHTAAPGRLNQHDPHGAGIHAQRSPNPQHSEHQAGRPMQADPRPKLSNNRQSSRASTLSSRPSPNLGSAAWPSPDPSGREHAHPYAQARQQHFSHGPMQPPHLAANELKESTRHNLSPLSPPMMSPGSGGGAKTPREAWIETPPSAHQAHVDVAGMGGVEDVEVQFEQLLDNLQIPAAVREKFNSVSSDIKSSLLTSSFNPTAAHLAASAYDLPLPPSMSADEPRSPRAKELRKRLSTPLLRKAKSSTSLGSPGRNPEVGRTYKVDGERFVIVASPLQSPDLDSPRPGQPARGQSFDLPRAGATAAYGQPRPPVSRGSTGPASRPTSMFSSRAAYGSPMKHTGKGLGIAMAGEQPEAFLCWLRDNKATDPRMEVGRAKKLRMLLRHESTEWVAEWLIGGGCGLVLDRLGDLLEVEWREEQHDDQMLHELLRCVRALFTSEVGKLALRQHFPRPFPALSKLLFSEKKPGDLPTRQLIIEMWTMLFDLHPSGTGLSSPTPLEQGSGSRPSSVRFNSGQADRVARALNGGLHESEVDIVACVRSLLVPEADEPEPKQEIHDFMKGAHRPKIWKAWIGEMADICRDYFWIMCHGSNTLWALDEVDESLVERPVAPGGATGGVEFEAMNYVTCHFKLLNMLCKHTAQQSRAGATEMHKELFISGMDRILATFRKASTTYYPTLHLELARYVTHLRAASPQARLPHLIDKMVGSPPENLRRRGVVPAQLAQEWLPRVGGVASTDGGRRGGFDMQF